MDAKYGQLLLICPQRQRKLERLLERLGYRVDTTHSLPAALNRLNETAVDLILLDAELTGPDFPPFLAALKQSRPLARPPILLLGKAKTATAVKQALADGADDYLFSLNDPELAQARLAAVLERGRLRELAVHQFEAFNEMEKLADDLKLRILPLGIALSAEKDFDRLLEQIVSEARAICRADASILFMCEDDQMQFAAFHVESLQIAQVGVNKTAVPFPPIPLYDALSGEPNRRNLSAHVALQGSSINIANLYETDAFDFADMRQWDAQNDYQSISCLTVPLKNHNNEALGVLHLINSQDLETGGIVPFDLYCQLVVESLASQAAVALNTQILLRREQSLLELEREMAIGRQIQRSFLPDQIPSMPGWQIAVSFQPAFDVAGDFYDIFPLVNRRIGFVIADICGKGVGAALFMALVRSLVRAFSQQTYLLAEWAKPSAPALPIGRPMAGDAGEPLTQTIVLTNNYLVQNHLHAGMFATLFFGLLDTESGQLIYVNCGHTPPIVRRGDGREIRLPPTGPALGLTTAVPFAAAQLTLDPGDLLFAFTDGVLDARNEQGAFFGETRLAAALRPAAPAADLIARLQAALQQHIGDAPQTDDITMLALQQEARRETRGATS
jgi:phosphoserine phosphatase RsbU/P